MARLTELAHQVRIGDLNPSERFPDLHTSCDVRMGASLTDILTGAGAIFNLAAEHRDDVRPISRYHETNVEGARQVCQAARDSGIQTIVFTSSVAVYGFQPFPVNEEGPFNPFNPYGETKLLAEEVYRAWADEDPARTLIIVRPTVVFGEGNRGNVFNLLRQIASRRFLMIGPGTNKKSMAYVGNLVEFLIHTFSFGSGTHIFNYADVPDMDMNTLVCFVHRSLGITNPGQLRVPQPLAVGGGVLLDLVARLTRRTFPVSAVRIRKFCESTQFSANRALSSGFKPSWTLEESLERTIQSEFRVSS